MNNDNDPPDLAATSVSTTDAARLLGVSKPTVQRWVDSGHLKAWKTVGGHRKIDGASLRALLLERTGTVLPYSRNATKAEQLRVMVVDDNALDAAVVKALIERVLLGAIVEIVDDGFSALVAIGREPPDILITDVVMPNMDGFEMLKHVADLATGRPKVLIAMSALPQVEVRRLGTLARDVRLLTKPVTQDDLTAAMSHFGITAGIGPRT